jgi:predicted TIM-barrel fold metal-dependent hydrolase
MVEDQQVQAVTTGAVDVWANWWPTEFFAAAPELATLYRRLDLKPRMSMDVEALADEARRAGMSRILLSATAFPGSPADNDSVAKVVNQAPDLLTGCASVDPREGMAAVHALRHAVQNLGFRALKLFPYLYGAQPDHAIYFPLYAACVDLGIPVLLLTGHTAVRQSSEPGRPSYLDAVALHFPELVIIAGHAGYPWVAELVSLAWKHDNIFIDTSGHRPKYMPQEIVHYMNSYGRGKVLFGSGWPLMDYPTAVAEATALPLREASRAEWLSGAANRIFGW